MNTMYFKNVNMGSRLRLSIYILVILILILSYTSIIVLGVNDEGILGDIESYSVSLESKITSLALSDDGDFLVAGTEDGTVAYISLKGNILWTWSLRGSVVDIEGTDDLSKFAVITLAREVYLYNSLGIVEFSWERGGKGGFVDLALDSSASRIAVIDSGDPPTLYLISVSKPVGRWEKTFIAPLTSTCYLLTSNSKDPGLLAVSVGSNVTVWDISNFDPSSYTIEPPVITLNITTTDISKVVLYNTPTRRLAIAVIYDRNVSILEWPSLRRLLVKGEYVTGDKIVDLEVSRGGSYVYVGSSDYNVYCFKWVNGKYILNWGISVGNVVSDVDISSDGRFIVVGTVDGWLYLISKDGDILWKFKLSDSVTKVSISLNGKVVAAGTGGGKVYTIINDGIERYNLKVRVRGGIDVVNVTILKGGEVIYSGSSGGNGDIISLLLQSGNYTIILDNIMYGTYTTSIVLKADTIVYTPHPMAWIIPKYPLTIRVRDADTGAPIGGVKVKITHVLLEPPKIPSKTLNVTIPPTGEITLALERDIYIIETVVDEAEFGYFNVKVEGYSLLDPYVSPVILEMKPIRGSVKFIVKSVEGIPLSNAKVEVYGVGSKISDASGSVTFENLRYGSYVATITHEHYLLPSPIRFKIPENELIEVYMKPKTYKVRFNVYDAEIRSQIPRASITLIKAGNIIGNYTITSETNVIDVPYGHGYVAIIRSTGYQEHKLSFDVERDLSFDVMLSPIRYTIMFTVVGKYGVPIPNASIKVIGGPKGPLELFTDANGTASVSLRPGRYMVMCNAKHYVSFEEVLEVKSPVTYVIPLKPETYSLTITAIDPQFNVTIPKYTVEVVEAGKSILRTELTAENRTISLPYGNYTLKITARHYTIASKNVVLADDIKITVPLTKALYPLTVIVKNDLGEPVAGAYVNITSPPIRLTITIMTDGNGQAVTTLPYGAYLIRVTSGGYNPLEEVVTLDKPLTVEITLQPTIVTVLFRYIPYMLIIGLGVALVVIAWHRRRKRIIPEEEEVIEEV